MTRLVCPIPMVEQTLHALHAGGSRGCEAMVLWLCREGVGGQRLAVAEVYQPEQRVAVDYFHVPPTSMRELMRHLRGSRFKISAQVHSHPARAFHSKADSEWAITRHVGALSLVLPNFARDVTPSTFLRASAVYQLSPSDTWNALSSQDLAAHLEIVRC